MSMFYSIFVSHFSLELSLISSSTTHTLWIDTVTKKKNATDLDSLEEDSCWDSIGRRKYHAISGARVSKINQDDEEIYDYEAEFSDVNDEMHSGDDYHDP